jgi:hypothetical protein
MISRREEQKKTTQMLGKEKKKLRLKEKKKLRL